MKNEADNTGEPLKESYVGFEIAADGKIRGDIDIKNFTHRFAMIGLLQTAISRLQAEGAKDVWNHLDLAA